MSAYDRRARLQRKAYIKLDRFEWARLGRRYELGAIDVLMLIALAALCDYENGDYFGTVTDLSRDTRASRRAVGASIERLAGLGLVQVVRAFRKNAQGHLRLLALDSVLVDVKPVTRAEQRECSPAHLKPFRAQHARNTRSIRAVDARNGANADAVTSDDAHRVREQARKGVRGSTVSRDNVFDSSVARMKRELNAEEVLA